MAYYKFDDDVQNETLMVVSLDAYNTSQAMVRLPQQLLEKMPVCVSDLITGNSYNWDNEWNFVALAAELPFHLFKIQQ
jgi:starch synthase (maltosyl-transferring)